MTGGATALETVLQERVAKLPHHSRSRWRLSERIRALKDIARTEVITKFKK